MATRADVAKLAGVSESTVSYALTGKRPISEETKKRVLHAVKKLGYQPHFAAGVLAGGRSKTIAMLHPMGRVGLSSSALEYVVGAANYAIARGYQVTLWPSQNDVIADIKNLRKSGLLAGAIVMESKLIDPRIEMLVKEEIPFVMIGRTGDNRQLNYVDRDFDRVCTIALDYLRSLGHAEIAFISNSRGRSQSELSVDVRFAESLTAEARARGINAVEILAENEPISGRDALIQIMNEQPQVTAVMGLSDNSILGLMSAASEFGIQVPEKLSVLALSTSRGQAQLAWPHLTSITVPAAEMGENAARILIAKLDDPQRVTEQHLFTGELQRFDSTAAPRATEVPLVSS